MTKWRVYSAVSHYSSVWASSGVIDVSDIFGEKKGGSVLLDGQAHGTGGGAIELEDLIESGQILFLSKD